MPVVITRTVVCAAVRLARRTQLRGERIWRMPVAARVAVTSHDPFQTSRLLSAGADIVLEPFDDAAERAAEMLTDSNMISRKPLSGA